MPNPTKRAAQVKARAALVHGSYVRRHIPVSMKHYNLRDRVFILPADPASLERMREQAIADLSFPIHPNNKRDAVNEVFRSLGLTGGRK